MTTDSLSIPITSHRVAVLLATAGAATAALAFNFSWAFLFMTALVIVAMSAAENEFFLLAMIFMLPFQWRLESGLPIASTVRVLVVFGFFLGCLVRWRFGARELLQPSLSKASLCFLAAGVLSLLFGTPGWMEGAPEGIARLASYIGFYFVVLSWVNSEKRLRKVIEVIMVSTIALAAFGLIQEIAGGYTSFWMRLNPGVEDISTWQNRPPSFLDTPNNFAFFLNLVLPLSLACWWLGSACLKRLGAVAFCSGFIALFITQSRGGLVALGVTLLVAIVGLVRGRSKQMIFIVGLSLMIFLLYLAGTTLSPEHLGGIEDTSSVGRLILWGIAWNLFGSSPLFGVGLWNFPKIYGQYIQISFLPPMILGTHNIYLQLLSETGGCGFVAFFGLIIIAFRNALRLQRSPDHLGKLLGFAVLWSLCSVLIHGFVESPLENPPIGNLLWILFALIAVKIRLDARRPLPQEKLVPAIPSNGLAELGS
jgi:O-antigen ligase